MAVGIGTQAKAGVVRQAGRVPRVVQGRVDGLPRLGVVAGCQAVAIGGDEEPPAREVAEGDRRVAAEIKRVDALSVGDRPDPNRPTPVGGGEQSPVAGEEHLEYDGPVARELSHAPAGRHVPESHDRVVTGGGQQPAVGAEGDAVDLVRVTQRRAQFTPAGRIPKASGSVPAARGQHSTVRGEGRAVDVAGLHHLGILTRARVSTQYSVPPSR